MLDKLKNINPVKLILVWIALTFLIYPNFNIIIQTFFSNGELSFDVIGKLFSSARAMKALKNSFILALTLVVTVNILGIFKVFVTEYFDIKGAGILRLCYSINLVFGGIILVNGYNFIYGGNGIITKVLRNFIPDLSNNWFMGYFAVAFIMTFACTQNHVIFLKNAFRKIDYQVVEAAKNMGASQWQIISQIILPTLKPTLFVITILIFITGMGAVAAPLIVGGADFQTINPMIIQFSKSTHSRGIATLLSLILGMITVIMLVIMNKIEKGGNYISVSKVKSKVQKQKIENKAVNILVHTLSYITAFICLLPALMVLIYSFTDSNTITTASISLSSFTLSNYARLLSNSSSFRPFMISVIYSVTAAIISVVLCLTVAKLIHGKKGKFEKFMELSFLLPWMLPSTLIALGLLVTYDSGRLIMFNKVLMGTPYIMVIAYVIVKIPFTYRMLRSTFYSIDSSLEEAAKSMGASKLYSFRKVALPIILPSVTSIAALNFNSLLADYDVSVFLYHPLLQPLGIVIRNSAESMIDLEAKAMSFVYSVVLMTISSFVLYFAHGREK